MVLKPEIAAAHLKDLGIDVEYAQKLRDQKQTQTQQQQDTHSDLRKDPVARASLKKALGL